MKDLLKNNWINILGVTFLFTGFLYFLKLAIDYGWLPPEVRAALGLALGATALFSGLALHRKNAKIYSQVVAGLGMAIMYATFGYISFSDQLEWSHNALLISLITTTIISGVLAIKQDLRILYLVSTIGGLITPLILKVDEQHDFSLFIYLLIINSAALYVSAARKWQELKIISFISSLAIYCTYYVLFDPISWEKPFFYIAAFFGVYCFGMLVDSWKQNTKEVGLNQYLELINAIHFVLWCTLIFNQFDIPNTLPMLVVGVLFLGIGFTLYYTKGKELTIYNGGYLGIGALVAAIACSDTGMFLPKGMHHVVNAAIWIILIGATFFMVKAKNLKKKVLPGIYGAFLLLTTYWYCAAWNVEWIAIGKVEYIPFLNPGAVIWIGLALMGFLFSNYETKKQSLTNDIESNALPISLALISHVIIGGLLTVQILNLWEAYAIPSGLKSLTTSISWIVYALIIYIWSNINQHRIYKYFGGIVLVVTSIKIFAFDLLGSATIQKVIFLVIAGALILVIGKLNKPLNEKESNPL